MIPSSGVLQAGTREIAFIDHGQGNLEPRVIQTGPQIDDSVVVLSGLHAGDRIVSSANFLVDSEAQLQSTLGSFSPLPQSAPSGSSTPGAQSIQIDLSTDPSPPRKGSNTVSVRLRGADGKPVSGAQVTATFFMLAMPAMGMGSMHAVATLADRGQGVYSGSLQLGSGGTWKVTIAIARNGQTIATKKMSLDRFRRHVMIARIIEWCSRNPFIVFTGAILLAVAGVWSMRQAPLDALPDISDVQVIIHTPWPGEPPNVIEDQVTYPIVSALLSAPHVKGVRAQTMFGDSYVFVVFEDGTDLYWARSRVTEYLQQIAGQLPAGVHPAIGPDATGAGWVYEYAILDRSHTHSLADLRALQDWYLRYQLETVPGVAEVASIGGFVRQYQVNLDPQKLFSYGISAATVIDRIRQSTNEVGGDVLDMNGAEYMVRGLGYLRSLSDLENVPVATKNGTPVLVRDLGTVSFGPDVRRGAADWQGQGETVGGIVVMRYGSNALTVINGVKAKLREIAPSLPPGVEIVTGYDRSWLIDQSIHTLKRDLILEAIIVSFVSIAFLFHFRSALVPILTLPDCSPGGLHSHVLPPRQLQHHVAGWSGAGHRRARRRGHCHGGERLSPSCRAQRNPRTRTGGTQTHSCARGTAGWPGAVLLAHHHRRLVPAGLSAGSAGRTHVPAAGVDQNAGTGLFLSAFHHPGSGTNAVMPPRQAETRVSKSGRALHTGALSAGSPLVFAALEVGDRPESGVPCSNRSALLPPWQPVHARAL